MQCTALLNKIYLHTKFKSIYRVLLWIQVSDRWMHTQRQDMIIISVVVGQGGNQVAVTTGLVSSTVRNIWQTPTKGLRFLTLLIRN